MKRILLLILMLSGFAFGQATATGTGVTSGNGQFSIEPLPVQYALTVTVTGTGTITGLPNGAGNIPISCPPSCGASYASGTSVMLSEVPGAGETFAGWSGACSGASSTCLVVMTEIQAVTANFTGSSGGGPTAYTARTDSCNYNVAYKALCSADPSCNSVCDPTLALGEESGTCPGPTCLGALLQFTEGAADTLPFPALSTGNANQNDCWTDPDFNTYECFITDQTQAHVNGASQKVTWPGWSDGGFDAFNSDSTLITVLNNAGVQYLFHLIPSIFHAHTCSPTNPCILASNIVSSNSGSGCTTNCTLLNNNAGEIFSHDTADGDNVMFEIGPSFINNLTITSGPLTTNPVIDSFSRTSVVDFTSDTGGPFGNTACSVLPPGYVSTWEGQASVSIDDTFTIASGGGAPWPAVPGVAIGTGSTPVTTDIFVRPQNNLSIASGITSIVGTTAVTATMITSASLSAQVNENVTITGNSLYNGTYTLTSASNTTPFTYVFSTSITGSSIGGTATVSVPKNTMYQITTAGTEGPSEPNWIVNCPLASETCTDGTAVQFNIGPVGGQAPGFDVMNYRPNGCSYINTRTGKMFRGHSEFGANVVGIANSTGTLFNITLSSGMLVNVGNLVTYTAGSDASYNGNYTVASIISNVQFTATGASHITGSTVGGKVSEPWGPWMTDDVTICNQVNASPCPGTVVPLNEKFTLHAGSQLGDPRYGDITPTGAGAIVKNFAGGGYNLSPTGFGSCTPVVNAGSPNPVFPNWPSSVWSATQPYAKGQYVADNLDHNYYASNVSPNLNRQPSNQPANTAYWTFKGSYCYDYLVEWATNLVRPCLEFGPDFGCDSHRADGYLQFYQGGKFFSHLPGEPNCQITTGTGPNANCPAAATAGYPGGPNPGVPLSLGAGCTDEHGTYRNVGTLDLQPVFVPYTALPAWPNFTSGGIEIGDNCAFYDKVISLANLTTSGGGTVTSWRFGPNYNTGTSALFSTQNAIGVVSQLGDMVAVGSDFMNTRGDRLAGTPSAGNPVCQAPLRAKYAPAPNLNLLVGDTVYPITGNGGAYVYITLTAGLTAGTPVWCQTVGCTVEYGTAYLQNEGTNSCRGDLMLMDVLNSSVVP